MFYEIKLPETLLGVVVTVESSLEFYGPVAHLGEHLVCTEEVAGSSPVRSTNLRVANQNST